MSIHYAIHPAQPGAHVFHVTCTVDDPEPTGQLFILPAWIPGSYMIREFSRNIVRITALTGDKPVTIAKLGKQTWRSAPVRGPVTLVYEVYAWDLSVRAAHLDQTHGFFNGTSVFLLPVGFEHERCTVDILPPDGDEYATWKVATGLTPMRGTKRGSFGRYVAADYDELIDCPVEMGTFASGRFDVLGVPHEIVITGHVPALDMQRLTADLTLVCEAQIRLFEPKSAKAPFDRYSFLTMAVDSGHGGLEHRNSTALLCSRADLPALGASATTEGYRNFLGLASHEYFHSWNVKRIKPAAFVPYDLTQENPTRLLWAFEGFTSYYDDLILARGGLISSQQYFDTLGKTFTTVLQRSNRLKQSIAESSFDAWIKYYRQDENAPNSVVSYYQKGSLVGLALDLYIRKETSGRKSLDDVMRLLWKRYKDSAPDYRGVLEGEYVDVANQATGLDLAPVIDAWTEGLDDPDFAALLEPFGIDFIAQPAIDQPHFALLGISTASTGTDLKVAHVFDFSPAQAAGLSAGDTLVALEGLRITPASFSTLLLRHPAGAAVELLAFRRDELMRFNVALAIRPPLKYSLKLRERQNKMQTKLRNGWLASK